MIKSLSNITDISVIDQNASNNLLSFHKIEFNEIEIGSGGFGSVYKVTSIDGKPSVNYVLKIFTDEKNKQHAYDVVNILHNKLKKQQQTSLIPPYHEFPELIGLPFMAFKGYDNIAEKHCVAFLMYNLFDLGYEDYGSDTGVSIDYKGLKIQDKLYLAFQFSKTIKFLHSNNFIHSDINEQSIFINASDVQLALIDFDSGYHFDSQRKPSTLGKASQWIINLFGGKSNSNEIKTEDRIYHEYWILANGLFEIIFGVMPFFFLKDSDEQTKRDYLETNNWPIIDERSSLFNSNNSFQYNEIIKIISELEDKGAVELVKGFKKVFNEGFFNNRKRLSPGEWSGILETLNKSVDNEPLINNFTSDKKEIKIKGEHVELTWEVEKFNRIYINNELIDLNVDYFSLALNNDTVITLKAINDLGAVEELIDIKAIKLVPKINFFKASNLIRTSEKEIMLTWETINTSYIKLTSIDQELPANGFIDVSPTFKSDFVLTAFGHFDEKVESKITLDVVKPKINKFISEVNLNEGIDNVDIIWNTEYTDRVSIQPLIGDGSSIGKVHVPLKEKTEFRLVAHGLFSDVERAIYAYPFPVPIIEQLHNSRPNIEFNMEMDTSKLDIPDNLVTSEKINFNNRIEFKSLDFQNTEIASSLKEPNFVMDNELLNRFERKKMTITDLFKLVRNKFSQIKTNEKA